MPEDRGLRFETIVASLIGLLALLVSAYTAYIQRQQVRAQVWPILEFNTGNDPKIDFWVANKGSGPALIRHVVVTVDGAPVADWNVVLKDLLGPGHYSYSTNTFGNVALSPGETLQAFSSDLEVSDPRFATLNQARFRLAAEICYCSTLGDCWTVHGSLKEPATTTETRRCPGPSETTFKQ